MKPKSLILLGVSGMFGLVAAALFTSALGQPAGTVPTKDVMVLVSDVEIGALLTEENCKLEQWPENIIPEGIVGSFEQVKEKRINTRLTAGTPIFQRDLLDKYATSLVPVPKGKKVVGLKVPSEDHIAGLLQPGHTVDVIGVFEREDRSVSNTFLRGIKVFSVSNKVALENESSGKSNEDDTTVGLIVSERQSEMLSLVKAVANVKLAIRGVDDGEAEGTELESQDGMISLRALMGVTTAPARESLAIGLPRVTKPAEPAGGPFRMQLFRGDFLYEYEMEDGKIPVLKSGPPAPDASTAPAPGEETP
jgi:Flp pilus assembly protein CpaB